MRGSPRSRSTPPVTTPPRSPKYRRRQRTPCGLAVNHKGTLLRLRAGTGNVVRLRTRRLSLRRYPTYSFSRRSHRRPRRRRGHRRRSHRQPPLRRRGQPRRRPITRSKLGSQVSASALPSHRRHLQTQIPRSGNRPAPLQRHGNRSQGRAGSTEHDRPRRGLGLELQAGHLRRQPWLQGPNAARSRLLAAGQRDPEGHRQSDHRHLQTQIRRRRNRRNPLQRHTDRIQNGARGPRQYRPRRRLGGGRPG